MPKVAPWNHQVEVTWWTQNDDKVRSAHIPLHDKMEWAGPYGKMPEWRMPNADGIGIHLAHYPGDPRLPIELRINCRCYLEHGDVVEGSEVTIGRPIKPGWDIPSEQLEVVDGRIKRKPLPDPEAVQLARGEVTFSNNDAGLADLERFIVQEMEMPLEQLRNIPIPGGGKLTVTAAPDGTGVNLRFEREGELFATVNRSFEMVDGELWVNNKIFYVENGVQGQGFGSMVNKTLRKWYEHIGVRGVRMTATDAGSYVWAKAGYDWDLDRMSPDDILDILKKAEKLAKVEGRPGIAAQAANWAVTVDDYRQGVEEGSIVPILPPDFPLPIEVAMLGWQKGKAHWAGKDALLDSTWEGQILL